MNYKITLRIAIVSILFVFSFSEVSAQVVQKIGSNSFTINPKAVLELESTTKGFLPPRMTTAQQTAISLGSNEKGLIVYVTDAPVPGLKIWDGTKWVSFADTAALDLKAPLASPTFTGTVSGITSTMVGLGSVDNTTDLEKPISTATQTALDTKSSTTDLALKAPLASPTFTGTVSGITATMVGLGSIDNTTDLQKPISTATQTALDLKENTANKSTSITVVSNSDIKFPTEKAVIDYVNVKTNIISIVKKTANYTILDSDNTILCDTSGGTFKLTLPAVSGSSGKIYVIRKTDMSNIELTFDALTFADGVTVTSLNYPKTLRVQSNGTAWYIID